MCSRKAAAKSICQSSDGEVFRHGRGSTPLQNSCEFQSKANDSLVSYDSRSLECFDRFRFFKFKHQIKQNCILFLKLSLDFVCCTLLNKPGAAEALLLFFATDLPKCATSSWFCELLLLIIKADSPDYVPRQKFQENCQKILSKKRRDELALQTRLLIAQGAGLK